MTAPHESLRPAPAPAPSVQVEHGDVVGDAVPMIPMNSQIMATSIIQSYSIIFHLAPGIARAGRPDGEGERERERESYYIYVLYISIYNIDLPQ